jgi:hypothetical protein
MEKQEHWSRRFKELGWEANWRTAQDLFEYARRVRHDFPTARDRDLDFADHVAFKRRLDRVAHAFSHR